MTTLVVAAHPDDEVLGAGGTIARRTRAGEDVAVLILGQGLASRESEPDPGLGARIAALRDCASKACGILGVTEITFRDLPDNSFDSLPLLDVVREVEAVVGELEPDTVFTHHPSDLNVDHSLTARAVLTATRPAPGCPVRSLCWFEVASSTEWAFQALGPPFKPSYFVDVADTLELKTQALACYESEVRPFPHPRSAESIRARAVAWGSAVGCEAAEAFEVARTVERREGVALT